jgi:hypothetical protein
MWTFIGMGILLALGFLCMWIGWDDRPEGNDSGVTGSFGRIGQEYHPKWPPGNKG